MGIKFRTPKDLAEPQKISATIRIPPRVKDVIDRYAERYGVTASAIISAALEDYAQYLQDADPLDDRKKQS